MTRGDRMRADDNGEGERDRASATAVRCVVHVVVALGAQGAVVSTRGTAGEPSTLSSKSR
jgi:hypothetical protein